ncbi:conserved Plasmodium protein, unknown function, partial [Plasmodium malariae]
DNGKDNVGDSVGDSDDHSSDLSIDEDFLSEDIMYSAELYDDEITDLYLINIIRSKIEEYFKNVQVKKFWDMINVQHITEFEYNNYTTKKTSGNIARRCNKTYDESIYDYIQIIKKNKTKKDMKTSEITKKSEADENQIVNSNNMRNMEKGKIDKEFLIKDLFNNTMKNYNVNEVQIYLSYYDHIFLKSIICFYLLLSFSVEIISILYENLDLYSIHIFFLYEKLNERLFKEQQKMNTHSSPMPIHISRLKNKDNFETNANNYNNFTQKNCICEKRCNKLDRQNDSLLKLSNSVIRGSNIPREHSSCSRVHTSNFYDTYNYGINGSGSRRSRRSRNKCNRSRGNNRARCIMANTNYVWGSPPNSYDNHCDYPERNNFNFLNTVNAYFGNFCNTEKKLDVVVFFLLKLLMKSAHYEEGKNGRKKT